MTSVDLMKIKERQKGAPLIITLAEGLVVVDGLPGNVVVLDQDNEIGHGFRLSNNQYADHSNMYEMTTFKYSNIAYVKTNISKAEMIEILGMLETDNVITGTAKQDILDSVIIKK